MGFLKYYNFIYEYSIGLCIVTIKRNFVLGLKPVFKSKHAEICLQHV
jgi:hypothetical protein